MKRLASLDPQRGILVLATMVALIVATIALAINGNLIATVATSGGFLIVGLLLFRSGEKTRNVGVATALIGQAIALTGALQGHPWQIDAHMLFFALLACLIPLRSIPAILMATAITAAHHLSLALLFPAMVYPGGDLVENLVRTVFHAVIVLLESGILVATVVSLNRMDRDMMDRNAQLEDTLRQSDSARQDAEAARHSAEAVQEQAKADKNRAEALLQESQEAEKQRLAAERQREKTQAEFEEKSKLALDEQTKAVSVIGAAMERIKGGDLTARIGAELPVTYKDIGKAFNEALQAMDEVVSQVAQKTEEMKAQVYEITAATEDLANRTEVQAQVLRESSEGLEKLTQTVSKTEETVREADSSAQLAQDNAKRSEAIVSETSQAMQAIQTEASEISQIVKVIDDIAFQTNLLALNAGVEAARAGDAGRGFAVVASEVRGLAQRSSESATNIRDLIERSGEQVDAGSTKIEKTVASLSDVLSAVQEISDKTNKISEGAHAQTTGISELNQKVARLDSATQQNAAMFEETSAACTNLLQWAETLQQLTASFQVSSQLKGHTKAA